MVYYLLCSKYLKCRYFELVENKNTEGNLMKKIALVMLAMLFLIVSSQSAFAMKSANEGKSGKIDIESMDKNKNIRDSYILRPTSYYLTINATTTFADAVKMIQVNNAIEANKKAVEVLIEYDKETYGILTPNDLIHYLVKKKTDKSFDANQSIGGLAKKLKTFSDKDNAYQSTKLTKADNQDVFAVKNSDGVVMLAGCTWFFLNIDPNYAGCTWGGACG
jgi:hypothetical protein